MTDVSTDHATFRVERTVAHPPTRVYAAFADQTAKARWFAAPDGWTTGGHTFDFRVGGREHLESVPPDGPTIRFDATYLDIVPGQRIIYAYDMHIGEQRISVSLASIELEPTIGGTHVRITEHGIFLDGLDRGADRERGTIDLVDRLVASLDAADTAPAADAGSGR